MVPWVKSQNSFLPDLKIYSFGPCSARNLMLGQRVLLLLKFEYSVPSFCLLNCRMVGITFPWELDNYHGVG